MSRGRDMAAALSAAMTAGSLHSNGITGGVDSSAVTSITSEKLQNFDFSDLVGATGDIGDLIKSDGDGGATWASDGSTYQFKINYATGGIPLVSGVDQLPTGWTVDSADDLGFITVNHTAGKIPRSVSFLAKLGELNHNLALKPATNEMVKVPQESKEDKVQIKCSATETGASGSHFAYINLVF